MRFRFPAGATVPDNRIGAAVGARVKVHDAIIEAAGHGINCEESKVGKRRITVVHLKPGSDAETQFVLTLLSGIHPEYKF